MRAILALSLLLVACTPLERHAASEPVDFGFTAAPADFQGVALCGPTAACPCCCYRIACAYEDTPTCEPPDLEDRDPWWIPICNACLAGSLDAGAACSIIPN